MFIVYEVLGLCPQSYHPPTKPCKPSYGSVWSISHFTSSSLILTGQCLLYCKNNISCTWLLIVFPHVCPRLAYFWNHTCLYPLHFPPIYLSEDEVLNFLKNILFGSHAHSHIGECKFSFCVSSFHLKEESNNTELTNTEFEHSLVCLHDASMLLPWTKMGTKWFVKCFFLKWGIAAPIWELSILPHPHPCSPLGWCWQIWSSSQDAW